MVVAVLFIRESNYSGSHLIYLIPALYPHNKFSVAFYKPQARSKGGDWGDRNKGEKEARRGEWIVGSAG